MGKRVDHDATQEVSSSQLVPDAKPPAYPSVSKNDASMWLQAPVSADDFVGAPKRPQAPRSSRTVVVGVIAVMFVAALGGGIWYAFLRESPAPTAAGPTTPAPAPTPVAAEPADAAVAEATPDAAIAIDAAVAEVAAVQADAVSSAGKLFKKKPVKRPAKKRRIVKKRTAKKRR
ncbi:MAG TPA: hypothetical protein VFS15_27775 [Kofleriaceae bacterium]|nr:hypothetical protein [Kofleriaceae bacterium]